VSFSLSAAAMRCFGSDPEVGASRSHVRSTPRTRRRRRHGAGQLGYWKAETPNVRSGWYITGDTMMRDEDNHFSFVGRNDDIITSSGYRIGPIDVESVVMEHPKCRLQHPAKRRIIGARLYRRDDTVRRGLCYGTALACDRFYAT